MPKENSPILQPPPPPSIPPPLTGKRVFYYFLAFFIAIAAVNGIFVWIASSTNPGTVTEEAYNKGLAYNKVIEEAASQMALGWKHTLTVKLDTSGKHRVALRMRSHNHDLLSNASALIRFYRPVEKGIDFDVPLTETRPGSYIALVAFPAGGVWDAYIAVRKGNDIYRAHQRVIVR